MKFDFGGSFFILICSNLVSYLRWYPKQFIYNSYDPINQPTLSSPYLPWGREPSNQTNHTRDHTRDAQCPHLHTRPAVSLSETLSAG